GSMAQNLTTAPAGDKRKRRDQVRDVIRRKHFSLRTEKAYCDWMSYTHVLNRPGMAVRSPLDKTEVQPSPRLRRGRQRSDGATASAWCPCLFARSFVSSKRSSGCRRYRW